MNWISFFSYLGILYAFYYLALILVDSRASPAKTLNDDLPVLTFSENVQPEKISIEDYTSGEVYVTGSPASIGSGGVSIKDLFELARKDAIEFTKSVSF